MDLPQVPTFRELGYTYDPMANYTIFTRTGTPADVINKLWQESADTNLRAAAIDREGKLLHLVTGHTQYAEGRDAIMNDMVDAIASLVTVAFERSRSFEKEMQAEAERRSEQFRITVLDGLAHAFKTPLTVILASTSGLIETGHITDGFVLDLGAAILELGKEIDESFGELGANAFDGGDGPACVFHHSNPGHTLAGRLSMPKDFKRREVAPIHAKQQEDGDAADPGGGKPLKPNHRPQPYRQQNDGDVQQNLNYSIECEREEAAANAGRRQLHCDLFGSLYG